MNHQQFLEILSQEGFPEPVEVVQVPNGSLDLHSHPFAVKALVLEGSIEITIEGRSQAYEVGDVFTLDLAQEHSEVYGSDGVRYLASRKSN